MVHVIPQAGKAFLHDFAAGKLVREPDLAKHVPVLTVACKAVQYARYKRIARADRTDGISIGTSEWRTRIAHSMTRASSATNAGQCV